VDGRNACARKEKRRLGEKPRVARRASRKRRAKRMAEAPAAGGAKAVSCMVADLKGDVHVNLGHTATLGIGFTFLLVLMGGFYFIAMCFQRSLREEAAEQRAAVERENDKRRAADEKNHDKLVAALQKTNNALIAANKQANDAHVSANKKANDALVTAIHQAGVATQTAVEKQVGALKDELKAINAKITSPLASRSTSSANVFSAADRSPMRLATFANVSGTWD
jgi:hypothetical protein